MKIKSTLSTAPKLIISLAFLACFILPGKTIGAEKLTLKANVTSVQMGRTVQITASLDLKSVISPKEYLLLPYVNHHRWGAQQKPDSNGKSTFLIPLPNPGIDHIQVIAVKADLNNWMGTSDPNLLMVGRLMPSNAALHSNEIAIKVQRRQMPKLPDDGHLYCIQYENWFGNSPWETAEAVPLFGFYNSYNEDVMRQHILWFVDMGVNSILLDWSNHIWSCTHWDQRGEGARSIVHNTTTFLEELAKMRDEGIDVPKVVIMPGVSNGPPATMEALNEELYWVYQNYILDPRFKGLFQLYDGKPLMVILDTGAVGDKRGTAESAFRVPFFKETLAMSETALDEFRKAQVPVNDSLFTIRFMSSQNQLTKHDQLGYWSWMDGQLKPIITYLNGKPEAIAVTPSFFGANGWTAPEAYGRRGGTSYIESFKVALESKPRVVFLHQFNEFAGQKTGYGKDKNMYLDEYSMEFSDDTEPVSLTARGFRDNRGGWGFYYLNLTHALTDLLQGEAKGSTILAVDDPTISKDKINLNWSVAGAPPKSYTITLDGKAIHKDITETTCEIPAKNLTPGKHTITVTANGANTRYPLSDKEFDTPTSTPMPVKVSRGFRLK
jgi:hypothetical protein